VAVLASAGKRFDTVLKKTENIGEGRRFFWKIRSILCLDIWSLFECSFANGGGFTGTGRRESDER
jgi:hypothetical protein